MFPPGGSEATQIPKGKSGNPAGINRYQRRRQIMHDLRHEFGEPNAFERITLMQIDELLKIVCKHANVDALARIRAENSVNRLIRQLRVNRPAPKRRPKRFA